MLLAREWAGLSLTWFGGEREGRTFSYMALATREIPFDVWDIVY